MKRLLLFAVGSLLWTGLLGQVPPGFSYQAVVRDNSGSLIANRAVSFRLSILAGSESGTIQYSETHSVTTNAFGLATLTVGAGTPVSGSFGSIPWVSGNKFLKVELDPDNGTAFTHLGTTQLMSVPYALHSQTSAIPFVSGGGVIRNVPTTDHFLFGTTTMYDLEGTADDTRMIFNKQLGAFRAGIAEGDRWDIARTGAGSAAFGFGTIASGDYSSALGSYNNAAGISSFAIGDRNYAPGERSFATGQYNTASGINSIATGDNTEASGGNSISGGNNTVASGSRTVALGSHTIASSAVSVAIGHFNVGKGDPQSWFLTDPVFEIGVGFNGDDRKNAMTVLRNGNVGIGPSYPQAKLDVAGQVKISGGNPGLGKVLTSDNNGLATWESITSSQWTTAWPNIWYNTGNVGLGTTSPAAKLHISASQGPNLIIADSDGGAGRPGIQFTNNYIHYIAGDDGSEEVFGFYAGFGSERSYPAKVNIHGPATADWGKYLSLTHDGSHGRIGTDSGYLVLEPAGNRVGLGTDAPTQGLDVNGNARFRGIGSGAYSGALNRTSDGTLTTATSDARLKENVKTLQGGLDKVMRLRGVSFTWISNPEYGMRIGFIAQEVENVVPELVFTNETDGYKGVNYAEMSAILVEAINELNAEIDRLKQENRLLSESNNQLDPRIGRLEKLLGAVETAKK